MKSRIDLKKSLILQSMDAYIDSMPNPADDEIFLPKPTSEIGPSMEETKASDPSMEETKASDPSMEETKASDPSMEETKASDPSMEETKASDPSMEETKASGPSMEETKASGPSMEETKASGPSMEEKLSIARKYLDSITPAEYREYFKKTYGCFPDFDLDSYSDLNAFERMFGRGPISDKNLVKKTVVAQQAKLSNLFAVLCLRLTPKMMSEFVIGEYGFESDLPLNQYEDLVKFLSVYHCCRDVPCDADLFRLVRAAELGWINMFNCILPRLKLNVSRELLLKSIGQALIMAAEGGHLEIFKLCLENGATHHLIDAYHGTKDPAVRDWIETTYPAIKEKYEELKQKVEKEPGWTIDGVFQARIEKIDFEA